MASFVGCENCDGDFCAHSFTLPLIGTCRRALMSAQPRPVYYSTYDDAPRDPRQGRVSPITRLHPLATHSLAGGNGGASARKSVPMVQTNLRGVRIVGDLSGIPLLKFSADTGARAVQAILREPDFKTKDAITAQRHLGPRHPRRAALRAFRRRWKRRRLGLKFQVFEAAEPFSTIVNFPKAKPIYTYPTEMTPAGQMQFHADVKEALLDELETATPGSRD